MKTKNMTLEEIRTKGLEALAEKLGPAGMIRFLQMLSPGTGDYTRDRHKWLPDTDPEKIVEEIIQKREQKKSRNKA